MFRWLKTRKQRAKELDIEIEEKEKRVSGLEAINGEIVRRIENNKAHDLSLQGKIAEREYYLNKIEHSISCLKSDWGYL